MFMGLRPDGLDHRQQGAGGSGGEGSVRRGGSARSRGRKWQGWNAKK